VPHRRVSLVYKQTPVPRTIWRDAFDRIWPMVLARRRKLRRRSCLLPFAVADEHGMQRLRMRRTTEAAPTRGTMPRNWKSAITRRLIKCFGVWSASAKEAGGARPVKCEAQ
jgi:hypothetical protein